jgi:hypothetical protein
MHRGSIRVPSRFHSTGDADAHVAQGSSHRLVRVRLEQEGRLGDRPLSHVTGTHGGAALGCAPTRKCIEMWGMGMARVAGDQIVEGWNAWDFMSLYQQVGTLPAIATA